MQEFVYYWQVCYICTQITFMLTIKLYCDKNQSPTPVRLVECPECGQKLVDIVAARGEIDVRVKCRRCKQFVTISVIASAK